MSNETDYKPGANQAMQVLSDCLAKYGQEDKSNPVGPDNVQLVFAVRPDEWGQPDIFIRVLRDWQPALRTRKDGTLTDEITINQVLGIKFDMFNSGGVIKSKLAFVFDKTLKELREKDKDVQYGAEQQSEDGKPYWQPDIELICITPQEFPITPIVLVYYKGEQIKTLDIVKDIL